MKDQGTLVERWRGAFFALLESSETGPRLKETAVEGALGAWTEHLTAAVVSVCRTMGWRAAGRGHLGDVLPVPRNEYLALDIVAFASNVVFHDFSQSAHHFRIVREVSVVAVAGLGRIIQIAQTAHIEVAAGDHCVL